MKKLLTQFKTLTPTRQTYALLGGLMLMAAFFGSVVGTLINFAIALSLIFTALTGMNFMVDVVKKAPWNKK